MEDANDLTPEIHALALDKMKQFPLGPLFTPPRLQGTLQRPGASGCANWSGTAFDPESGLLFVRTSEDADTNQVCVNVGNDPKVDVDCSNNCPYGASLLMYHEPDGPGATEMPESKLGPIRLIKAPYARLVAIDLNAGEIAWKVPFGAGSRALREHLLHLRDGRALLEDWGAASIVAAAAASQPPSPGNGRDTPVCRRMRSSRGSRAKRCRSARTRRTR